MKNPNRMFSGARARQNGLAFENLLLSHARSQGILPIKMPLGCERRGRRLIQVKTLFDWILVSNGITVFLDCKSLDKGQTFSYSMLTDHQVDALEACMHHSCNAGYLVYFKEPNVVVFFNATQLRGIQPGYSLHAKDGLYLGGFEDMALGNLFL